MVQGHEDGAEDDEDGDAEVEEWVGDEGVEPLFEPPPTATTVPLEQEAGHDKPTWRTCPLFLIVT